MFSTRAACSDIESSSFIFFYCKKLQETVSNEFRRLHLFCRLFSRLQNDMSLFSTRTVCKNGNFLESYNFLQIVSACFTFKQWRTQVLSDPNKTQHVTVGAEATVYVWFLCQVNVTKSQAYHEIHTYTIHSTVLYVHCVCIAIYNNSVFKTEITIGEIII